MAAEHVLMFPFHRFHSIYSQFRVRFGVSTLEPSGERHRSKSPGPNLSFILFFSLMKISCHLGVEHVPSVQSFGHHIIKFSNIVKNFREVVFQRCSEKQRSVSDPCCSVFYNRLKDWEEGGVSKASGSRSLCPHTLLLRGASSETSPPLAMLWQGFCSGSAVEIAQMTGCDSGIADTPESDESQVSQLTCGWGWWVRWHFKGDLLYHQVWVGLAITRHFEDLPLLTS